MTFAEFLVGASNRFAYRASRLAARWPDGECRPLLLCGAPGIGKSHLARAIGYEVRTSNPLARVAFHDSASLVEEVIGVLRATGRQSEIGDRLRQLDVLILEDVHLLVGRPHTQREVGELLTFLVQRRCQIVLTSIVPPGRIPDLHPRLRAGLAGAILAEIGPPDRDLCARILRRYARRRCLSATRGALSCLARDVPANPRLLEGVLTRLAAEARFAGLPRLGTKAVRHLLPKALQEYGAR